jgi:hypothetical protein
MNDGKKEPWKIIELLTSSGLHQDLLSIMQESNGRVEAQYPEGSFRRLFWEQQIVSKEGGKANTMASDCDSVSPSIMLPVCCLLVAQWLFHNNPISHCHSTN